MNSVQQGGQTMRSHATATFTADGRRVTVHAMLCGMVTVKRCHAVCCVPEWTPAPLRFATILADRRFADPMPIWCYAVEHPEGLFVIDAGAEPSYNDAASWAPEPRAGAVIRSFIKLNVREGETLPDRLVSAGLTPANVRAVVLTHQHVDHTGTVPAFPSADIWTTQAEDAAANRIGALHWRWRDTSTAIRYVDRDGDDTDLGAAVNLTNDGRLTAIHTPGHTPGSVTVRLRTDQTDIWFTGDTSFTAEGMDPAAPTAGIHSDMRQVRRLQAHLRDAGVLLPAHDPAVPDRLSAADCPGP
jgi:N-acyl homoserine lactone hydrolase